MSGGLRLARGSLHVERAVYQRHFAGLDSVVLLRDGLERDGADLLVLPVRDAGAGGLLLKIRNAAGDRVVDASEVLRAGGAEGVELAPAWRWDDERALLRVVGVFAPRAQAPAAGAIDGPWERRP